MIQKKITEPTEKNKPKMIGREFGRWTVLEKKIKGRRTYFKCQCECGTIKTVEAGSLRSGGSQSCGCLAKELKTKHGMSGNTTYNSWHHMLQRCNNKNNDSYKDYGGRGITVCRQWAKFESFFEDMGLKPANHSIDRIDNNGNYEPSNCKWSSHKEQRANTRPASCGTHRQYWFRAWHKNSMQQHASNNQNEFARQYGLGSGHISACLSGKKNQHKGWVFEKM